MAAGDFYFAINATFRFIHERFGPDALIAYWRSLGREYYAPLGARFRSGGLPAVADYWADFFAHEPGGQVAVTRGETAVMLDVQCCPALAWLREHGREPAPNFCGHCRHINDQLAEAAGMTFRLEGGGGQCRQTFSALEEPRP